MGVYVGISYNEYSQLAAAQGPGMSSYTATGGSLSVAAGLSQPMSIEPIAAPVLFYAVDEMD